MRATVADLRGLALRALKRMYRPEEGLFAFRLRRRGADFVLEGISRRYTAIVLIALVNEAQEKVAEILAGQTVQDLCIRLLSDVQQADDIGEVALTLWAARAAGHPEASKALQRLQSLAPDRRPCPTVELAWSLTALTVEGGEPKDEKLAQALADRLLASFNEQSSLFTHWPNGMQPSWLRSHVACYADLVYPIQALSHYYAATGCSKAFDTARRCAKRMCTLQGPQGQWWWHYDVRTGQVVERYPVYSVHQDAMGPMALFAVQSVCDADFSGAIERSIRWLNDPWELTESLVDKSSEVIWRKVGRHEPGKLIRSLQAMASRLHPGLRVPGMNLIFPPGRVDYESRPYHMGWILYTWPADRVAQMSSGA